MRPVFSNRGRCKQRVQKFESVCFRDVVLFVAPLSVQNSRIADLCGNSFIRQQTHPCFAVLHAQTYKYKMSTVKTIQVITATYQSEH